MSRGIQRHTRQMIKMIDTIPDDGCLILFDVDVHSWRNVLHNYYQGLFRVHALQTVNNYHGRTLRLFGDEELSDNKSTTRDVYITWRE